MFMGQETVVKRRTNELRIKHQFGFDHMLVSAKHVSLLIRLIQPKYFLNTAICGEHQSAHESTSGDGKRLGIPLNPVTSYLPKTKDCRLIQRVCDKDCQQVELHQRVGTRRGKVLEMHRCPQKALSDG